MNSANRIVSIVLFTTILISLSSCNNDNKITEDNPEILPGVTLKDHRITGSCDGVSINASYSEVNEDKTVYIYKARYIEDYNYAECKFNSDIFSYKSPSDNEYASHYDSDDYYTDGNGNDYEALTVNADNGFYLAEPAKGRNNEAALYELNIGNSPCDRDYTGVLTAMSHNAPDSIPHDEKLPTQFDYWEVLTFSDNSGYAIRRQTLDGIPILNGYSPYRINWSDKYNGMGMESGAIIYTNEAGYWYVHDARFFVEVDEETVDSCQVKGIRECFESGVKGIKSQMALFGNDPVIFDISFGYIMVAEYDPDEQPPIWSDEPDNIGEEFTTVPIWRYKAYYPASNQVYSVFVNASTGELV